MVETDWKEILSFSQRELTQSDKEKLCDSLCWMEADDIELNFTDLKTLFRLAQDILKLKSEQVNNLVGQLKTTQRKGSKTKVESPYAVSPTQSNDSALETITHQEEIIRANKEILEQLYADIADLESKKSKLEGSKSNLDIDSESSRDVLSEMNAVAELEQEVAMRNKHIRKLLSDVKILEDENTKLKDKLSVLKDKLTEATQLINNLTEQMVAINNECSQLKDILGIAEQQKAQLSVEIEGLRKELFEKDSDRQKNYEEIKSKVQHWKNIARTKKAEVETLSNENQHLKEDLLQALKSSSSAPVSPKKSNTEKLKIKELQEKLIEASNEIEHTATIIEMLRAENIQLKAIIDEVPGSFTPEPKNESDDGKERTIITKLRKKVKTLTVSLQEAEEMIAAREKELTELTSQLQLLRSDEGMNALLEGLKNKKRQLKFKDEGIKTLVHETNSLNQLINELQFENETLRQKLKIPPEEKIPTKGIMKDYRNLKDTNSELIKEFKKIENKLIGIELNNRNLKSQIFNLSKFLNQQGHAKDKIKEIAQADDNDNFNAKDAKGVRETETSPVKKQLKTEDDDNREREMLVLIEENKGLRNGLQDILEFLKDNSKSSCGVLTLQCPSLETILLSMEARNSAGWFAPHMATVMELRAALGGKDALLTALHEARKETFGVMEQLSEETKKSSKLERKLHEIELINKQKEAEEKLLELNSKDVCEFGTWMSEKEQINVDIRNQAEIENMIDKGNSLYESQLKKGLEYFHKKFKDLFDKLTTMAIEMSDNQNKWSIQEEDYKAEIENLKAQLHQEDDDFSDLSPGMIPIPDTNSLRRKCSYLEESYRHIRTLNENMKNEILETKKDAMLAAMEHETHIQKLILSVANLTDKLRCSISYDLFWKQNSAFNDVTSKYRKILEERMTTENKSQNLLKRLEEDKMEIMNRIRMEFHVQNGQASNTQKYESNIETTILRKQIQQLTSEIEDKNKEIVILQSKVTELQETQGKIIDESLASMTKEDIILMKDQLDKIANDNKILKEQCHHVGSQLDIALIQVRDIALIQLQDTQQRQMSRDMEINMMQHQILDLQSTSDNKAIMSRLSGEVMIAHLQSSESYKRIERLSLALNKEKEAREEAEEMLRARQKIFEVYALRYETKFKYMFEVMQAMRQQYQGSLPLISVENFLNKIEDYSRKNHSVDDKLSEIEDLRSSLISKHSIFDQILDVSRGKCLEDEDSCPHKLKYIVTQSITSREIEHVKMKMSALEQSREDLIKHCNYLEKTLVLVSQGLGKSEAKDNRGINDDNGHDRGCNGVHKLELEDIKSDEESSHRSKTITLTKPRILKQPKLATKVHEETVSSVTGASYITGVPIEPVSQTSKPTFAHIFVQTIPTEVQKRNQLIQTEEFKAINEMKVQIESLQIKVDKKSKELSEAMALVQKRSEEILSLNKDKIGLEYSIQNLRDAQNQKDTLNERLRLNIDELRKQLDEMKIMQITESNKIKSGVNDENKSLLKALKQLENDKNIIAAEYKELLNNEREEYSKSVKELQVQLMEMQSKLDRRGSESSVSNGVAIKEVVTKYTMRITELEVKCFKLQSELDECKAEVTTYQSEAERWKDLAAERLTKMEQLNLQLEERHCHEVKSYKAENQHWISQISDMQREHMDLRTRLTDQKTVYIKQLSDKDTQIEQLRVVINNLKTQVMNMQTLISVNDPSFDLSAIVEVEETDSVSQMGSDRLELKFDSTVDLHDSHDDFVRIPASSTTIWQEPVIERLRREKQMAGKQNAILRRQIKVLAARERRARLDAQNLKNQVFRISTTGNKVTTAETAALHNKIASLHAQLTSARRDTQSSIALWDKWKRSQQSADRWQARYEEKNQEVVKLEASLHLAKSAIARLEKEKRTLLLRLNETKSENQLAAVEKQEAESPEKSNRSSKDCAYSSPSLPVSSQALLDRVEAQQRRIAALEVAEKGNEFLVSEYERSLAEITSLKGQVLKLESTLLESQIRTPLKAVENAHPEIEYWKSYCDMLKEENVQLTHKINSLETMPTTAHQHRVNDLEQTVLTLRGVVNKLQSEQKSGGGAAYKRVDSRPNSSRSGMEKGRIQLESHRIEIVNLKRTIHDKDLLLEKSKEMLKIAAEREDELLRENTYLRRQLEELTRPKGGFLSA